MGAIELRNRIIELLDKTDEKYLEEVLAFVENKQTLPANSIEELPSAIQELLNESIQQADEGNVIPHNKVMEEVKKRYNLTK